MYFKDFFLNQHISWPVMAAEHLQKPEYVYDNSTQRITQIYLQDLAKLAAMNEYSPLPTSVPEPVYAEVGADNSTNDRRVSTNEQNNDNHNGSYT